MPWVGLFGVYAEACLARLFLSRWPRPMLDDPKQLTTAPLHLIFQLALLSLLIVIPIVVVSAVRNRRKFLTDRRYTAKLSLFAVGLLAIWIVFHYDPGRVWYWFLD